MPNRRGFTLVEVMTTLCIIAVLAALAIYGVVRHLASAKTSEAKNMVGAISRAAHGAFAREYVAAETLGEGAKSAAASHLLCDDAQPVPAAVPQGTKYQPSTKEGADFATGDKLSGWKCLRFAVSQPIHYQLSYERDGSPVAANNPAKCVAACYEAGARGDLNANGTYSLFARTGHINTATGRLKASSQIYVEAEFE